MAPHRVGSHLCKMLSNFWTEYQPQPLISQIPSKQHLRRQLSLRFQTATLPSDTHIRHGISPYFKSGFEVRSLRNTETTPHFVREGSKRKKQKKREKKFPKLWEKHWEFRESETFSVRTFKIHEYKIPKTSVSFNCIIVFSINFTIFCEFVVIFGVFLCDPVWNLWFRARVPKWFFVKIWNFWACFSGFLLFYLWSWCLALFGCLENVGNAERFWAWIRDFLLFRA